MTKGLSGRSYSRQSPYIVMDSPFFQKSFVYITGILRTHGFRAPQIHKIDENKLFLEDFGDTDIESFLKRYPQKSIAIYKKIVDILIKLQTIKKPPHIDDYSNELMLQEASIFADWYPRFPKDKRQEFFDNARSYLESAPPVPHVLVLRDVHIHNFMVLPDESLGILDYQDAVWGPITYDIISLLEDARTDISKTLYNAIWDYFCDHINAPKTDLEKSARIVATIRHLKIIGIFFRYSIKTGNHTYLQHIPRVINYVRDIEWVSDFL